MTGTKNDGKDRRPRGTGSIIKKQNCAVWYIRFYREENGRHRQIEMSTGTTEYSEAQKFLTAEMAKAETTAVSTQDVRQVRYEDIKANYLRHKPNQAAYHGWSCLDAFFKGMRVIDITPGTILDFIEDRSEDVESPTIRRNLIPLRAAFNWAADDDMIGKDDVPHFRDMPADSESAAEYISPADFDNILKHIPENLHPLFRFLYGTSCRLGTARNITWGMMKASPDKSVIEVPAAFTKQRKPLTIVLDGYLAPMAAMLREKFKTNNPDGTTSISRRDNERVFDSTNFRIEWSRAVAKAGLGTWNEKRRTRTGVRIHDCRGSAATNLLDAGVDEGLVLKIGGWKTRAMLDRYTSGRVERIRAAMIQAGKHIEKLRDAEAV